MKQSLEEAPKFRQWKHKLDENGLAINGIEEVYTRHRYNGEVLFSLVLLDAKVPEGGNIPPLCLIKGSVVSILICLIDEKTEERYLLMVSQRRICDGGLIYEHVAGMVDGEDDPKMVAIREAEEEAGITLQAEEVIPLNREGLFPSTGTCDEEVFFFFVEKRMNKEAIMAYNENQLGAVYEHETTFTHILTVKEAMRKTRNTNGLLNIYLYADYVNLSL
ncbi:MAG: NUDIX domain-containing protein [Bacteroidota bacterium]